MPDFDIRRDATSRTSPFERIRQRLADRSRCVLIRPSLLAAAVLIPLYERDEDVEVLFTLRADTLRRHSGQVSFPGGVRHPGDDDLLATALRESEEEIGLRPDDVEVLGALDDMITNSGFLVTPYVARMAWPVDLHPSAHEIAEVFSVPLHTLLDPSRCRIEERIHGGRAYYPVYHFTGGRHDVWGITGHIVAHFLEVAFGWRHPELQVDKINPRPDAHI